MAKIFLDLDETNVNIANNGDEVFGQQGDESVVIMPGVTGVVLDGNVEAVTLDGNIGDYLFQQQGNQLLVYSGGVLVATIPVQADDDGSQLTFDDGTFTAEFGEGAVISLGGEDVPSDAPGPIDPTPGDDDDDGETYDLTTATDTITGTDGDDTINGVSSSLSSERTLNPADQIDGGAGTDTLNVEMKGSFAGFSGDGKLANVEIVNLTSASNIAREFDATGVTGVEQYNIDGTQAAVNLKDLGDLNAAIVLSNQSKGTFTVAYATDVTKGTSDVQALGFEDVGTKDTVVGVTIAGVEELGLMVTGDNFVDFTAAATKTVTIEGDGNLTTATGPAALKVLDAADATGNLDINLGASTDATTAALGSGDDKLTVGVGDVTKNAELTGGDGDDTLVLSATGTVQYLMSGFETLNLANTAAALTFSAANTSDLETIQASKTLSQDVTFAGLGTGDYTVELLGPNPNNPELTLDHSGATTINVMTPDAAATVAAPSANDVDVTLTNSASVDMMVASKMSYQGDVTATKATSVELDVQGEITGATIAAAAATGVIISAVENDSDLTLTAGKATDLNIMSAADLTFNAFTLTSLESLTANTKGILDLSAAGLAKVASVTLEGAGSAYLNNLGSATLDYGVTVTASGLSGDDTGAGADRSLEIGTITTNDQNVMVTASGVLGEVELGVINAGAGNVVIDLDGTGGDFQLGAITGKNVTVNAAGALGLPTYDDINAGASVTLTGAELSANDWTAGGTGITATGSSLTVDATGGIDNDTLAIVTVDANDTTKVTATGDLGLGTNTVTIDASAETTKAVTIDASGMENVTTGTITGGDLADTIKGTDGDDVITGGDGADVLTGGAGDDAFVFTHFDSADEITDFDTGEDMLVVDGATGAGTNQVVNAAALITTAFGTTGSIGGAAISWGATAGAAQALTNANQLFTVTGTGTAAVIAGFMPTNTAMLTMTAGTMTTATVMVTTTATISLTGFAFVKDAASNLYLVDLAQMVTGVTAMDTNTGASVTAMATATATITLTANDIRTLGEITDGFAFGDIYIM